MFPPYSVFLALQVSSVTFTSPISDCFIHFGLVIHGSCTYTFLLRPLLIRNSILGSAVIFFSPLLSRNYTFDVPLVIFLCL